jgi:ATP-binding cassette subfamily F protein uup
MTQNSGGSLRSRSGAAASRRLTRPLRPAHADRERLEAIKRLPLTPMSTLLTARNLSKTHGTQSLFEGVSVQLIEGDRLGIIGPNGAGKSTLLRILAGLELPDEGEVIRRRGLRLEYVPQDDRFAPGATPLAAVVDRLRHEADRSGGPGHRVDESTRARITLSRLGFLEHDQPVETLSGGWRKRLSMACALALEPDVLLLDEPTNHLDLEGILWLEQFIRQSRPAFAVITHDRRFLDSTVKRLLELSRAYPGGAFEVAGNYSEFVRRKEEFLDGQSSSESSLANTVRRDTAWLQQGIQGRRTRNKSQIQASRDRKDELQAITRRNEAPSRTTSIDFQATERKTRKLLAMHAVSKSMGDRKLFHSITLVLSPGQRIGLVGSNGSGKTTLLRLMSGEISPDSGTIKQAADLRIVSFSQHRADLVATQTLHEALSPRGDIVDYRGKAIHITAWASKFLFAPNQLRTFVGNLSGGEQARVLIARLMLEPADVLLLDEPTNDLDIPSLEVLEHALLEFPGAIVLVTHDRFMLERIATEFLALDGRGGARSFASMTQWLEFAAANPPASPAATPVEPPATRPKPPSSAPGPRKLSFKLQRDLDGMEAAILQAEALVQSLEAQAHNPDVIADHVRLAETYRQLDEAQRRVKELYERWAELDAMQSSRSSSPRQS